MFNRHLCIAYFFESFLPPTISMPFQVIFALLIISLLIKHCTMPPGMKLIFRTKTITIIIFVIIVKTSPGRKAFEAGNTWGGGSKGSDTADDEWWDSW